MYRVASESLEENFSETHFQRFLNDLVKVGCLQASNFSSYQKNRDRTYFGDELFFLAISPQLFSEILDVSFGQYGFFFD
jgi:hypothetical protein